MSPGAARNSLLVCILPCPSPSQLHICLPQRISRPAEEEAGVQCGLQQKCTLLSRSLSRPFPFCEAQPKSLSVFRLLIPSAEFPSSSSFHGFSCLPLHMEGLPSFSCSALTEQVVSRFSKSVVAQPLRGCEVASAPRRAQPRLSCSEEGKDESGMLGKPTTFPRHSCLSVWTSWVWKSLMGLHTVYTRLQNSQDNLTVFCTLHTVGA